MFEPAKNKEALVLESISMTLGDWVTCCFACQGLSAQTARGSDERESQGPSGGKPANADLHWAGLGRGIVCGVFQGSLHAYCRSWTDMMGPWLSLDASKRAGSGRMLQGTGEPQAPWRS